jgi:glycosyltransferase involved in cell wall biosynthesis
MSRQERLRKIGLEVLTSTTPAVFAHLLRAADFPTLSNPGVKIVPVVHNSQPAWQDPPAALNQESVPFVVAVSSAVGDQLREWGCRKPIVVLRHEVQRDRPTAEQAAKDRSTIRRRYGIGDNALLVGMIGQFKAQKVYTRAVRVLRALQEYLPARLMILGGWNQDWGSGRAAYAATCQQALEAGVSADLIMPGPVHPVDPYYYAFDVFLNTSTYEGLSIAMLEAIAYGCPVVSASAGGNGEALTANDRLVEDSADIDAYVDAILEVASRGGRVMPPTPPDADLIPRLWALLGRHGIPPTPDASPSSPAVLVVTENLNIGGPQRSLTNLLQHWPASTRIAVAVLDPTSSGPNLGELERDNIPVVGFKAGLKVMEQCQRTLELAERTKATTIAFWNAPAAFKLACAKVLEVHPMRLVDVSPGPMLMGELEELEDFPRRISFSLDDYFKRIDCFVAKYAKGIPPNCAPDRIRIIPNGVPIVEQPLSAALADPGSPALAVGTCCRIAPSKHIDYLIDMIDVLTQRLPDVTLTIVGGADPRHEEYASFISDKMVRAGLDNVTFTGPCDDVGAMLRTFSVFVMVSDDQGCPNASLEAMASGIPVVANASGGTAEQIDDGINGFLVDDQSPRSMAAAVERLLRDDDLRRRFGAEARRTAQDRFSMRAMVDGYVEAFGCREASRGVLAEVEHVGEESEDQDFLTARP